MYLVHKRATCFCLNLEAVPPAVPLSHQAAVNQHTGATGDTNGMLAIHLKLWSVFNQRPWVTAIELVPGASLMCGMATDLCRIVGPMH